VTGTCTYAGWETLPSGDIRAGTPRLGILDVNGDWLERNTTQPDVLVYAPPASVVAGRDVQLERAVEVLLNELDEQQ
jgi:C-terminal processing protease CtpA/Prc